MADGDLLDRIQQQRDYRDYKVEVRLRNTERIALLQLRRQQLYDEIAERAGPSDYAIEMQQTLHDQIVRVDEQIAQLQRENSELDLQIYQTEQEISQLMDPRVDPVESQQMQPAMTDLFHVDENAVIPANAFGDSSRQADAMSGEVEPVESQQMQRTVDPAESSSGPTPLRKAPIAIGTAAGIVVLAGVGIGIAVAKQSGGATPAPTTTSRPGGGGVASLDACLVGTWRLRTWTSSLLSGRTGTGLSGTTLTVSDSLMQHVDWNSSQPISWNGGGLPPEKETLRGTASGGLFTSPSGSIDRTLAYPNNSGTEHLTAWDEGALSSSLRAGCTATELTLTGQGTNPHVTVIYERIGAVPRTTSRP